MLIVCTVPNNGYSQKFKVPKISKTPDPPTLKPHFDAAISKPSPGTYKYTDAIDVHYQTRHNVNVVSSFVRSSGRTFSRFSPSVGTSTRFSPVRSSRNITVRNRGMKPRFPNQAKNNTHQKVKKPTTGDKRIAIEKNVPDKDLIGHRKAHILNGHRAGAGQAGKSEFPKSWSDEKIIHEVNKIANDPQIPSKIGRWNAPYKVGVSDQVKIRVDFFPKDHLKYKGKVSTAYPLNTPKNPTSK